MAKIVLVTSYDVICLGIRYLSAVLKKQGQDVRLVFFKKDSNEPKDDPGSGVMYTHYQAGWISGCNYDVNPYTDKELLLLRDAVSEFQPDLIGLSTRTFWLNFGSDIMSLLRKDNPNAVSIAGGYGPSLKMEEFAKQVDYVCFGEGETTLIDIARLIDQNRHEEIKTLNNIGYLDKNGSLVINPPHPPIMELDSLPFPDWSDNDSIYIENNMRITDPAQIRNIRWYDVFASRGCFSQCSYCMAGHWNKLYKSYGNIKFPRVRVRSPEIVIKEIVEYMDKHPLDYVRFMDSVFSASKKWLKEFLDLYKKRVDLPFFCNIEMRLQSKELLEMLCENGMVQTSFGIQSGSESIRKYLFNRKIGNHEIIEAALLLKKHGVRYQQDFIGFSPFDTEETLKETFDLLCALPPNHIIVFMLEIFPKSDLSKRYEKEKPKGLSYEHHQIWTYLWHLASYGGEFREYAKKIVSKYNATPLDQINELKNHWLQLKKNEPANRTIC